MKVLLDIKDNEATAFMELLKTFSYVKVEPISATNVELFTEIKEIKGAFKNVGLIKTGKLKARPVADLLNEL